MTTTIQAIAAQAAQQPGQQVPFQGLRVTCEGLDERQRLRLRDATGTARGFSVCDCPWPAVGQTILANGTIKQGTQTQPGRKAAIFYDLRGWTAAEGAAPPPQAAGYPPQPPGSYPPPQQQPADPAWVAAPPPYPPPSRPPAPQAPPNVAAPPQSYGVQVADRMELFYRAVERILADVHHVVLVNSDQASAKATVLEPAVVAQAMASATSVCMGWERGQVAWKPGQPIDSRLPHQNAQAPDDDTIEF